MSEWISIKDRMPEDYSDVLVNVLSPFKGIWLGRHHKVAERWTISNVHGDVDDLVTHWMPLPEPPKEKP